MSEAAVYDYNGSKLVGFNVMKVNAVQSSRVIGAPVESGQTSFDNKVLDPMKVIVTGTIVVDDYCHTVLSRLDDMYSNRNFKFCSVCDGVDTYDNLILQILPTIRDVDKFDFINVELTFVEAMLVQKESTKAANGSNNDCRNSGYSQGKAVK